MSETSSSGRTPASPSTNAVNPDRRYISTVEWIESRRTAMGEEWYGKQMAKYKENLTLKQKSIEASRRAKREAWLKKDMEERQAYEKKRHDDMAARWAAWDQRIEEWGNSGGFEMMVNYLLPGDGKKNGRDVRYKIAGIPCDISFEDKKITRWIGEFSYKSGTGKQRSGIFGVAKSILELQNGSCTKKALNELLSQVSGITINDIELSDEAKKRIEANVIAARAAAEAKAAQAREEEMRETPPDAEQQEREPLPLTDAADIEKLTQIMAKERCFPIDFARRMVKEGHFYFAYLIVRDKETKKTVNTRRVVVASKAFGFETGVLVGWGTRELKQFWPYEEAKGKNIGNLKKGAVIFGGCGPNTKTLSLVEGAYDAASLILLRERKGKPLQPDEAILALVGTRGPERLVDFCKAKGIKLIFCFDNDDAGYKLVEAYAACCRAKGVEYEVKLTTKAEHTISVENSEWGRHALNEVSAQYQKGGIKHLFLPQNGDRLELVVETNEQSAAIYSALEIRDRRERQDALRPSVELSHKIKKLAGLNTAPEEKPKEKARYSKEKKPPGRLEVIWHRKDWNELLQKKYINRCQNPHGLPDIDPSLNEHLKKSLQARGITKSETDCLQSSGLVYPAKIDGEPRIIWISLNPDVQQSQAIGFVSESLDGKNRMAHGQASEYGVYFGLPNQAKVLYFAETPEEAMAAWRTEGAACSPVYCPTGNIAPAMFRMAKTRNAQFKAYQPVMHNKLVDALACAEQPIENTQEKMVNGVLEEIKKTFGRVLKERSVNLDDIGSWGTDEESKIQIQKLLEGYGYSMSVSQPAGIGI